MGGAGGSEKSCDEEGGFGWKCGGGWVVRDGWKRVGRMQGKGHVF